MPSSLFSNDIKSENFERLLLAYRQQKISFIVGPHNGKIDTSTLPVGYTRDFGEGGKDLPVYISFTVNVQPELS